MAVLSKFIQADGIEAACGGPRSALDYAFDSTLGEEERQVYRQIFEKMIELLDLIPQQDELKITLDNQSLLLRQNGDVFVAVVAKKGHSVVKSLQRMVRRTFKVLGAPIDKKPEKSSPPPLVPPTPKPDPQGV